MKTNFFESIKAQTDYSEFHVNDTIFWHSGDIIEQGKLVSIQKCHNNENLWKVIKDGQEITTLIDPRKHAVKKLIPETIVTLKIDKKG